jgi:hypothetical protein
MLSLGTVESKVLPVLPIFFEGTDKVGRDLISSVRLWVKQIEEKSGRNEAGALAEEQVGG